MRNINLRITKAHIKSGEKVNPSKCAIANSIIDNIKNVYHVCVLPGLATIKVRRGNKISAYSSHLPEAATSFIRKFDDGKAVSPFSLKLEFKKLDKKVAELI